MDIEQILSRKSRPFLLLVGILLVLVFGLLDYLTGPELSLSIFYFLPIYVVTWYVSRGAGLFTTLLSICTWAAADFFIGRSFSTSFVIYWNIVVRLSFFVITTNLISDLKARLDLEERLARTDPLTHISNRRRFIENAEMEIARVKRSQSPFTIVYMDLDNFKEVNDWHGHDTGDQVLQMVADLMKKNTRLADTVARIGGDEFAILLPDTGEEAAVGFIRKLEAILLRCMREKKWPVTFSMGAITYLQPPKTVNAMMKETDQILYLVKQAGKNTFLHDVFSGREKDG